ncbi:helix-turn-helix domain-containing protein [Clostridium sp. MCC353]|uniref:helix-turn-helix domain-containing protein n=1 Tax=Clostridium sp. MCC353 TaxID=2592646 RepID=UPI001C027E15|nr:helix-turn-helix transcriptional regulator [Clostridium sp. MCC353]MBT9776081.1 helix-turn-helix domain-containing protein [Clostridium sp. MCC353]
MDRMTSIRLKELRKESGLTQNQLAQFLETDQSMITKLENGTRNLTVSLIDKICSLFGCTDRYLMGESDEYLPLHFAFRSNSVLAEDIQSIAAVNRIAWNLCYMNELMEEKDEISSGT